MKIILIFIISLIFVVAYVLITLKQVKKEYKNFRSYLYDF